MSNNSEEYFSFNIKRDAYYLKIVIKNNKIYFSVEYIDNMGNMVESMDRNTKTYYVEDRAPDVCRLTLDHIIDFFYENDPVLYGYCKLDIYRKSLLLLQPHTTSIGCQGSMVEILYTLDAEKIISIRDVKEDVI